MQRTALVSTLVLAAASIAFGASGAAAAPPVVGPDFGPTVVPSELHFDRVERGARITAHWRGPNRMRILYRYDLDPVDDLSFVDVAGPTVRTASGTPGRAQLMTVRRNSFVGEPDGWDELDGMAMRFVWPLVARQRSGESALREVVAGGRTVLRGTTTLGPNECAGLAQGVRTVDLDPRTLVPVRVVERRGRMVELSATFTNRRPSASDFSAIRTVGRSTVEDAGFVRRGAAAVADAVSYPISMPSLLPAGFALTAVGSAPTGGYLGPEGSFPRSRGVFVARWSRGLEQLSLSIRPAHGTLARDWRDSDPMGVECGANRAVDVQVGANAARYANDEYTVPHLWWRDGTTLYTLVGPFSADQLVTIANSLTPVE